MEEAKIISEFNEMGFQIQRLHNIWVECERLSRQGKFLSWNWQLDNAKKELYWDAKDLDKRNDKKYIINIEEINKKIFIAFSLKRMGTIYKLLTEKEIILREIQQECGKGSRYKSSDEDEMD